MKDLKDNWVKYATFAILVLTFLVSTLYTVRSNHEMVVDNRTAITDHDGRLKAEETVTATTTTILKGILTNLERLNAWQMEQAREQADHNARLKALEKKDP